MTIGTPQENGIRPRRPTAIGQAGIVDRYTPDTSTVLDVYVEDAFKGVGSFNADDLASKVDVQDRAGKPITIDAYKESEYFRPSIDYYVGMTEESAKVLSQYHDDQEYRGFVMGKAGTAQTVAGFGIGFATGIFEPKNLALGVATVAVGGPLISRVVGARRLLLAEQALGKYGSRATIGAGEGLVSAAIAEPSNRESAKTLQQDYTMTDTLWNVGLSTVLGAGLNTAPTFIKDKWTAHRAKTVDVVAAELDTATRQLATGKQVDVSAVEAASVGEISKKPIAEKAQAVSDYVTKNIDPEFISKAIPQIQPNMIGKEFEGVVKIPVDKIEYSQPVESINTQSGTTVAPIEVEKNNNGTFTVLDGNHRLKAAIESGKKDIEAIYNLVATQPDNKPIPPNAELVKMANDVRANQIINKLNDYGGFESIARSIDAQNKATVQKQSDAQFDPKNDTAIDTQAANSINVAELELAKSSKTATAEADFANMLDEISAMKNEGILTEADEKAMLEAFNSLQEKDIEAGYDAAYACLTKG